MSAPSLPRPVLGLWFERALPIVAGLVALLVAALVYGQIHAGAAPRRIHLAGAVAVVVAGIALVGLIAPRLPLLATARRDMLGATGLVAALGLAAVAILALYPPPLEASAFKAWDYLDKRWMIALFLLVNILVFVPGLAQRLLFGDSARVAIAPATRAAPLGLAAKLAVGALIGLLYMAAMLPETMVRFLDVHELVHLGAFQRIAQGAAPYLDARTQYGPGHQLLSYEMMQQLGFSVYGFRLSQAWMNMIAIAVLLGLWLSAFGWRVGGATIVAALILSPLLISTMWGWGLVLRWIGPALVGGIVPLLLWREVAARTRMIVIVLLALVCGFLAWLAQENLTGVIEALGLVLMAALVRRTIPLGTAILIGAVFVAVQVATLLLLLAATLGPAHLGEGLHLYFLSTGIVFQGMTNTAWSESGPWRYSYRINWLVILLIGAAALYLRKPGKDSQDDLRLGQILGMVSAAVPLTMLSLFRADSPHFLASSTAIAPLVVTAVAWLPGRFVFGINRANIARVLIALLCLGVYAAKPWNGFKERAHNLRTFANPKSLVHPAAYVQGLAIFAHGVPHAEAGPGNPFGRLGFLPRPGERCCYLPKWSWQEWNDTYTQIHRLAANRPTFVDVSLPRESSGVYFLADLKVGTPYVSRIMSVWTDGDISELQQSFAKDTPACVVSDNPRSPLTRAIVSHYRNGTGTRVDGPMELWIFCNGAPTPPALGAE